MKPWGPCLCLCGTLLPWDSHKEHLPGMCSCQGLSPRNLQAQRGDWLCCEGNIQHLSSELSKSVKHHLVPAKKKTNGKIVRRPCSKGKRPTAHMRADFVCVHSARTLMHAHMHTGAEQWHLYSSPACISSWLHSSLCPHPPMTDKQSEGSMLACPQDPCAAEDRQQLCPHGLPSVQCGPYPRRSDLRVQAPCLGQ